MTKENSKTDAMQLSQAAQLLGGELHGADKGFRRVSIDTRTLAHGDLFVALQGPNFDGHNFIDEAIAKGAVAVIASRRIDITLPYVLVKDTRSALGQLATVWRRRFKMPVVAVTGSNGKTTVKEMLASIFRQQGSVHATVGNLNNEIGVPLTLLGITGEHDFAVIEMGASHAGDIDYLSRIAEPDVAVITNAAPAHLEGFGDIAGVARTKGEIFNGLKKEGTAVINVDDSRTGLWRVMAGEHRVLGFGMRHPADFKAVDAKVTPTLGCAFRLIAPAETLDVVLKLYGRHNIMNALAASAAAYALGVPLLQIKNGLEAVDAVAGRLQLKHSADGFRIIDDTYNANPGSVRAALEVLASSGREGKKIIILGDMAELGNSARAFHEQIGRQARAVGVDHMYTVGELGLTAVGAFGKGARHFESQQEMIRFLCDEIHGQLGVDITVLVKGSRSMHMENVVNALVEGCRKQGEGTFPQKPGGQSSRVYHSKRADIGG